MRPASIPTRWRPDGGSCRGPARVPRARTSTRWPSATSSRRLARPRPERRWPAVGPRQWSRLNHVFGFVRIEDMAYDRTARMSNIVYVVDSGRGSSAATVAADRLHGGRIWKMVLDPRSVDRDLAVGPHRAAARSRRLASPPADNLESDDERPVHHRGSEYRQAVQLHRGPIANGRRTGRASGVTASPRRHVGHRQDRPVGRRGPTDVDRSGDPRLPNRRVGGRAASSTSPSSSAPGTFLVDRRRRTRCGSILVPGLDVTGDNVPDILNKREGGQFASPSRRRRLNRPVRQPTPEGPAVGGAFARPRISCRSRSPARRGSVTGAIAGPRSDPRDPARGGPR